MDWTAFVTSLVTSIVSTGVLLPLLIWLGNSWLKTKIEASVRLEYDKRLEEHKSALQKEVAEALRSIEEKAQIAADRRSADLELYALFIDTLPSNGGIQFLREHDFGN